MGLFRLGDFRLHSGALSRWKIDCDGLTRDELDALAVMLCERLPAFGEVHGVPRGGLRLAQALEKHATGRPGGRVLLVDDVCTTGASLEAFRAGVGGDVVGAVLFARGPCPPWVVPLFRVAEPRGEPA